jgi:hypothetical protein
MPDSSRHKAEELLARWRDAERRADTAEPGSPDRADAVSACEAARVAYQAFAAEQAATAGELAAAPNVQG